MNDLDEMLSFAAQTANGFVDVYVQDDYTIDEASGQSAAIAILIGRAAGHILIARNRLLDEEGHNEKCAEGLRALFALVATMHDRFGNDCGLLDDDNVLSNELDEPFESVDEMVDRIKAYLTP